MTADDARLVLAHGARLDAWAAAVSRHLGEQVPAFAVELEANRLDELRHAAALAGLAGADMTGSAYAKAIGEAAVSPDPCWNATLLAFIEERSVHQFLLAGRALRNTLLWDIAADEQRHVETGVALLGHLGVTEVQIEEIADFVAGVDGRHFASRALLRLNAHVADTLTAIVRSPGVRVIAAGQAILDRESGLMP
jgi:hypothetical protein